MPGYVFVITTNCAKRSYLGWPCDENIERLRAAYAAEPDAARREAILEELARAVGLPAGDPDGQLLFALRLAARAERRDPQRAAGILEHREALIPRAEDHHVLLNRRTFAAAALGMVAAPTVGHAQAFSSRPLRPQDQSKQRGIGGRRSG
ncbi:hypothetical protein [Neoroseomonas lacus]|uniref:Uncharacterized protein n=1 Tax=Neoroseomonas lacus TaxID=287609 RepID=A0A917NVX6_9PROT|nr:hypothetical protein [Neoroseomonas lacus]GGJ30248.1 hypothetical protein GCM10011320_42190 [Neoroseomonas lacus]